MTIGLTLAMRSIPTQVREKARLMTTLGLCGVIVLGNLAQAQLVPSVSANAPSTAASAASGLERAQRQVDNVYKWIKLADKPRPAPVPVPAPVTAPSPPPPPKPVATKPVAPAATPVVAATPQVTPSVAAVTNPAPAEVSPPPAAVAAEPQPAPLVTPAPMQVAKAPEPVVEEEAPLRVISQEQPTVPRELRNDLENARVMMAFLVGTDGKVTNARAVSSTNRKLERPTITAVSNWVFAPIKTPREVQVEIEFNVK